MLAAVCVGTNNLEAAGRFYDRVLAELDMHRIAEDDVEIGYGLLRQSPMFWVLRPYDKKTATFGNGSQVMFKAKNQAAVVAFHSAILEQGGLDEGKPGLRNYAEGYFGAYARDLDGNKLHAFCMIERKD